MNTYEKDGKRYILLKAQDQNDPCKSCAFNVSFKHCNESPTCMISSDFTYNWQEEQIKTIGISDYSIQTKYDVELMLNHHKYIAKKQEEGYMCKGCAFADDYDLCQQANEYHDCTPENIIWIAKETSKKPVKAISESNQGLGSQDNKETIVEASEGLSEGFTISIGDVYVGNLPQTRLDVSKDSKVDMVNKPPHYLLFPEKGVEVRDICKVVALRMQKNGYDAFQISDYVQMIQYLLRWDEKNGKEDLEKALFYLEKLLESM